MTKLALSLIVSLSVLATIGCSSKTGVIQHEETPSMPIYGNWCGLAYPKDISTMPQTADALDLICKKHDMCYVEKGMYACECDVAMKQDITELSASSDLSVEQRVFANSFKLYMSNAVCEGNTHGKTGLSRLLNNVINKSKQAYDGLFGESDEESDEVSDEQNEQEPEESQENNAKDS